jgi:hypothetical protein
LDQIRAEVDQLRAAKKELARLLSAIARKQEAEAEIEEIIGHHAESASEIGTTD